MFRDNRQRGFTLIELMIVVTLLGILAAIAFPSYMDQVRKARRTDAETALTQAVQRMELQFARNATYATATLNDVAAPFNQTQSPDGYYTITLIAPGVTTYTLQATPNVFLRANPVLGRVNQQLDAVSMFQINELGQKTHTRTDAVPVPPGWKSP